MTSRDHGLFQCGSCRRQYKRPDHLTRHVRSHLGSKPHQCHLCSKAFTRIDLLKRHVAAHEAKGDHVNPPHTQNTTTAPGRVTQACQSCSSNHLRCSETKPCRRCISKNIECVWTRGSELDQFPTPPESTPHLDAIPSVLFEQEIQVIPATSLPPSEEASKDSLADSQLLPSCVGGFQDSNNEGLTGYDALPKPAESLFASGTATPFGPFAFDPDFNIELDEIDLRFLDSYNHNIPFEPDNASSSPSRMIESNDSISASTPRSICTDAFQRSHWRFRPGADDHGGAEEAYLAMPQTSSTSETHVPMIGRITALGLATTGRDKLITTIMRCCRTDSLFKTIASFPSLHLLDSLLQFYLSSPVSDARSFLHSASFDPNTKRPELVVAMVAHGAVLTADPTLTKLGFALQESARVAIPKLWEDQNALIRDLELAQAFYITIGVGLWGGHSRKAEIAESFLQPLLTMLRRGGRFKRAMYTETDLDTDTNGHELEKVWRKWVECESFKRICFRVVQHDSNSSTSLLVNPLASYAELLLPLPAPDDLWSAPTAERWKQVYLSKRDLDQISVATYFDEPRNFSNINNKTDLMSVSLPFFSCIWNMSWEYIQLSSMQRAAPGRWSTFVLKSRQDELVRAVEDFHLSTDTDLLASAPELTMRCEQILLHLHVSIEDVQVLAGIEGPQQSESMYPLILEWSQGESARKAIWHAGQILRAARLVPKGRIQGPLAIMVYHASLVLWVYGALADKRSTMYSQHHVDSNKRVILDGSEDSSVRRFTQLGAGIPSIEVPQHGLAEEQSVESITSIEKTMDAVADILRRNFSGMGLPLLVEQMIQIMQGLRNSGQGEIRR